ncbi:tautomerase family protein [Stappia sp. ES.058]|uniref:tautomerase family protein n=1 Tax=Stappia sp. ES.058 TaxID=1881061 RepID=UPI00087980D5|nr:tautomerase family protein [Stappia sp. ES.058]SDU14247.1 4-oxalocrotonate tautomerase family enzyme [Stappia sp. ES.058]
MPIVRVTMIEGYAEEVRQTLARRLSDAVRGTIAAPAEGVTVAIEEVKPENYMRGGRSRTPGAPTPDPVGVVRGFLAAMEVRDLERAQAHLADGFEMMFPGGRRFEALSEMIAWGQTRYRRVAKTFAGFDTAFSDGRSVVFCHGTLAGEWLDGTRFEGVRFIDRFEVVDGRIARQSVWNDLGERKQEGRSADA